MPRYTTEQLADLAKLMPRVVRALRAADNAAKGYETIDGRTQVLDIHVAVARLEALDVGGLLDDLDDWCWHQPACLKGRACDNAEAR